MSANLILLLDIAIAGLLVLVGGLLIWLHFKIDALRNVGKKLPALSDSLAESLVVARSGITDLSRTMERHHPEIKNSVFSAEQTIQDLKYTISRAEKVLGVMDDEGVTPEGGAWSSTLKVESEIETKTASKPQAKVVEDNEELLHDDELQRVFQQRNKAVKKIASPKSGAAAYGAAGSNRSEMEQALRKALEERL